MATKTYPLEKLFYGSVNGRKTIALLNNDVYYDLFNLNEKSINAKYFADNFVPQTDFEEFLIKNDLIVLITDANGNVKQNLTTGDVKFLLKVLNRKLSMTEQMKQKNYILSYNIVNIVCDLLGLNINICPNTPFNFSKRIDIVNILLPAKKLEIFKKSLFDYVSASLIADSGIILTYEVGGRDYRIQRSLIKAKINQDKIKQNIFSVSVDLNGKIKVNDLDINEYPKDQGFQKTIKF